MNGSLVVSNENHNQTSWQVIYKLNKNDTTNNKKGEIALAFKFGINGWCRLLDQHHFHRLHEFAVSSGHAVEISTR